MNVSATAKPAPAKGGAASKATQHLKQMAAAIVPLFLAAAVASGAQAHSWYDSDCCSDKDCAPVSPSAITIRSDGYLVTLNPGDHPTVVRRTSRLIPFTDPDVRPSLDGEWNVCVAPFYSDYGDMGRLSGVQTGNSEPLCIYVPGAGA